MGLLGLVGDPHSTTKSITQIVTHIGPSSAAQTFAGPIKSITAQKSTAGIMGIVGLAAALWSASSYVGAFMRAANVIYETPEGRPIWKLRPLQVLVTLIMIVLLALVALAIVLTGPIVTAVAQPLGIGSTAVTSGTSRNGPRCSSCHHHVRGAVLRRSQRETRRIQMGHARALLAIAVWLIASALFAFYVANFSSYDKTYGALAGVVIFLVWMWLTNAALLLGMELNAERERSRELKAGIPGAERELQLDARGTPKRQKTT